MSPEELDLLRQEIAAETWPQEGADERPALGTAPMQGTAETPVLTPPELDESRPPLPEQEEAMLPAEEHHEALATSQPPAPEPRQVRPFPAADERPAFTPASFPEHEAAPLLAPDTPEAEAAQHEVGTPSFMGEQQERGSGPASWPSDERPGLTGSEEWATADERPSMPSAAWWQPEGRSESPEAHLTPPTPGREPFASEASAEPFGEGESIMDDVLAVLERIADTLEKGKPDRTGKPEPVTGPERERKETQPPPVRLPRSGAAPSLR